MTANELVKVCCKCKKSNDKDKWGHHKHHTQALKENKRVTHGLCPTCANKILSDELGERLPNTLKG